MEPDDILFDGAETYERKNDDYGDSWRKIGQIMHLLANGEPITLESVEDHISYGLFTRRMDKLARAYNGEFLADDMNFESVKDAHEDEMVYAAMHASNQEERADELTTDISLDTSTNGGTNLDPTRSGGQYITLPPRSSTPRASECSCEEGREEDTGE